MTDIKFTEKLVRDPVKAKSDDWHETAHRWLITINGVEFEYYTGLAHRIAKHYPSHSDSGFTYAELSRKNLSDEGLKQLLHISKAVPPKLDDVLSCLVSDAGACDQSFEDWASDLGMDTDSRKAMETYLACQAIAGKLRKAGINIEAERERLQDY